MSGEWWEKPTGCGPWDPDADTKHTNRQRRFLDPFMNTLDELHRTIGGTLKPATAPPDEAQAAPLGRVVSDSRRVQLGDVFWALVGPHHDGADFTHEAFARGASGAVVGRPVEAPQDRWVITVDDTLTALGQWARYKRDRFHGTVIAVTGSVGKTTTRQMIHTILKTRFVGTASPRNYNNHVGVPLSMLQIEPGHDYAVLELGASGRGEIAALAELCGPTIGAVTSVADAHLAGFGSHRAIAESKAELLAALPPDGHAVLADDPWLRRLAGQHLVPVTWVGRGAACDLVATDVKWGHGELHFRVSNQPFRVPIWGRHHLTCALCAVAVGGRMGLPLDQIAASLESFDPVPMRCEVTEVGGATIINDAYNASPTAMRAALELLRDFHVRGRRVFVCGDMCELGDETAALHRRLGDQVVTLCGADLLIACGDHARHVVAGARAAGMPDDRAIACHTVEKVFPHLSRAISPGDVVLVKGSRAMGMERVVDAIEQLLELQLV